MTGDTSAIFLAVNSFFHSIGDWPRAKQDKNVCKMLPCIEETGKRLSLRVALTLCSSESPSHWKKKIWWKDSCSTLYQWKGCKSEDTG